MAVTRMQYRAVFSYPEPWKGSGVVGIGFGEARETREEAEQDRPWRPEESHGVRVGIQERRVSDWSDI